MAFGVGGVDKALVVFCTWKKRSRELSDHDGGGTQSIRDRRMSIKHPININ